MERHYREREWQLVEQDARHYLHIASRFAKKRIQILFTVIQQYAHRNDLQEAMISKNAVLLSLSS
jgi:sigma54-dependent transcription regulator